MLDGAVLPADLTGIAELAGLSGQRCVRLRLLDVDAWHVVDVDESEWSRRAGTGSVEVTDLALLRALCSLPRHEPLPLDRLSPRDRELLISAGSAVAQVDDKHVTALLSPVVSLQGAMVVDGDWDRGLDRASRFAPFCPRVLVTRSSPELDRAQVESSYYGIGLVAVPASGEATKLVPPRPARARFGPATWQLRELAFAELVRQSVTANHA